MHRRLDRPQEVTRQEVDIAALFSELAALRPGAAARSGASKAAASAAEWLTGRPRGSVLGARNC